MTYKSTASSWNMALKAAKDAKDAKDANDELRTKFLGLRAELYAELRTEANSSYAVATRAMIADKCRHYDDMDLSRDTARSYLKDP